MKSILRKVAETLSRGKYFRRRLPREFRSIPFFVSPDAALRYLKPGNAAFDKGLLQLARDFVQEESVVWDIGANVGLFTFASAANVTQGIVVAIEADIWLAQLLRKSLALKENKNLKVRVLPLAVSEKPGVATFLIAKRGRASNALEECGRSQSGGIREKMDVPTLSLDTLLDYLPEPTLVKIDVEGAELKVLRGGMRLLRDIRPVFHIEVGGQYREEIATVFNENDYLLFHAETRKRIHICSFNTLFIPKESRRLQEVIETDH